MAKNEKLKSPLIDLHKKKSEHIGNLVKKYDKLYKYIKPLLEDNKKMSKIADEMRMDFIMIPMLDLAIHAGYSAQTLSLHKGKLEENFNAVLKEARRKE